MRLTTKGRYAVTAMLDLAINEGDGPITLADIAQRQGISLSYLEQLFSRLRKRNLVASVRGPGGGYTLGRDARDIHVAEVITAVDLRSILGLPATEVTDSTRNVIVSSEGEQIGLLVDRIGDVVTLRQEEIEPPHIVDVTPLSGIPEYFNDHIHPTRLGSKKIAELVSDFLEPHITLRKSNLSDYSPSNTDSISNGSNKN